METESRFTKIVHDISLYFRIFISNKMHLVGLVIILFFLADTAILQFSPWLVGISNPNTLSTDYDFNVGLVPPSAAYPFGTTYLGINLLTAVLKAIRIDVLYAIPVVILAALLGTFVGMIAAYFGGIFDEILMRLTDVFFSIPYIVLVIALGAAISRNFTVISLSLVIAFFPLYAKYARSSTLIIKNSNMVLSSKSIGSSNARTLIYHVFPNVISSSISQFALTFGLVIGAFATIAFIGLAPNGNVPELGYLTSFGLQYIQIAPWAVLIPSLFIVLLAISLNLIGDGMIDMLDPYTVSVWKRKNY